MRPGDIFRTLRRCPSPGLPLALHTYSLTQSLTQSLIHSLAHSLIHSPTHSYPHDLRPSECDLEIFLVLFVDARPLAFHLRCTLHWHYPARTPDVWVGGNLCDLTDEGQPLNARLPCLMEWKPTYTLVGGGGKGVYA